ncbi:MAG: lysophospholipid acyltransferase family protein [Gammaproteobacteria bacterium]
MFEQSIAPVQWLADNSRAVQETIMTDETSSKPAPKAYRPGEQARQARHSGVAESSTRRMSVGRRTWYWILVLLLRGVLRIFWSTCRVHKVIGAEHLQGLIDAEQPTLVVYWHQMHLFCSYYLLRQVRKGLRLGFLVSPSVTGEVPTAIARRWGAEVIRGSSTRSGGKALRDMYGFVAQQGISLVTTADGPKGPLHKFKPGAILLSRMTKAPILPMAYATEHGKNWDSWDEFIVPRPFSRIAVAIGEPVTVPADMSTDDIPRMQKELEATMATLIAEAKASLKD